VIADPRIVTKRYGRGLLEALPPARRTIGRWAAIVEQVRGFYPARHDASSVAAIAAPTVTRT
jgi:ATP-dependent DNA helicase DinG